MGWDAVVCVGTRKRFPTGFLGCRPDIWRDRGGSEFSAGEYVKVNADVKRVVG